MDDLDFDAQALVSQTVQAKSIEELDAPMTAIAGVWRKFLAADVRGHKLFVRALDEAVPHIARTLGLKPVERPKSNDNVCIVLTQIYAVGGHSKIAQDISRIVGAERCTIILTDLYGNTTYAQISRSNLTKMGYFCRSFMALKSKTAAEKCIELYALLRAVDPGRIFLLNHHSDVAAVAATYMFKGVTEFVHHGDHLPCLGATLDYSTHADVTYTCHQICKASGLDAEYVGMTLPDLRAATGVKASTGGPTVLATCGSVAKYQHGNRDCRYRWSDWAVAALKDNDHVFLHFGPPTDELVADVEGALKAAGIDPARYRFMGSVPSLQQALVDHGVDVYVASYPETGGRANLEALAAGLEVIVLEDAALGPLLRFTSPVSGWRAIADTAEMAEAIREGLSRQDQDMKADQRAGVVLEQGGFERFVVSGRGTDADDMQRHEG
jgi:hypothetical protein